MELKANRRNQKHLKWKKYAKQHKDYLVTQTVDKIDYTKQFKMLELNQHFVMRGDPVYDELIMSHKEYHDSQKKL